MGHIRVAVRCRGRTEKEKHECSPVVVEMAEGNYHQSGKMPNYGGNSDGPSFTKEDDNEAYITVKGNYVGGGKTYTVDQTFGPEADQQTVFENVAVPMFDDFYYRNTNGTIFAYGQTGTGKTYTMCGPAGTVSDKKTSESGIIPRVIALLFDTLRASPPEDHAVTVSYLEIYNENLTDLLLEDNSSGKRTSSSTSSSTLRIVEDKQLHSIKVVNLTEKVVVDPKSAIKTLVQGLRRRKTATTKLNDHSSRSHTIFTINLHRKDPNSQTFISSKLNLVDLAGSENIHKSGADSMRAKEAGNINQSLLALGRVINTLASNVDNSLPSDLSIIPSHIPYRESKLTRILQDSLGGHTLTALIATISPAAASSDETVLTLDYASRAKNIRNLPQPASESDAMLKSFLVRELCDTVSQLESDLRATRRKNGIFLDEANFESMKKETQELKIQLKEASTERNILSVKHQREINSLTSDKERLASQSKELQLEVDEASKEVFQLKAQLKKLTEERNADKKIMQEIKSDLVSTRDSYKKDLRKSSLLAHTAIDKLISAVENASKQKSNWEKLVHEMLATFKKASVVEIDQIQAENEKLLEKLLKRVNSRINTEVSTTSERIKKESTVFHNYLQTQHLQGLPDMDNKDAIEKLMEKVQANIMENLMLFKNEVVAANESVVSRVKIYHDKERDMVTNKAAALSKSTVAELSSLQNQVQSSSGSHISATLKQLEGNMTTLKRNSTQLNWTFDDESINNAPIVSESQQTLKTLRNYINDEDLKQHSDGVEVKVSPKQKLVSPSKLPPPKTPQSSISPPLHQVSRPYLKRSMIPQLSKASSEMATMKKRKVLLEVENLK